MFFLAIMRFTVIGKNSHPKIMTIYCRQIVLLLFLQANFRKFLTFKFKFVDCDWEQSGKVRA